MIFWDNDGVLVDTEELFYKTTREVLAGADIEFGRASYAELILRRDGDVWDWAAGRGVTPADAVQLKRERNRRYRALLRTEPLVKEGVREALETLAPSFRMAIVTSSGKEDFAAVHDRSGLLPFFDFVVARGDCARVKPDPAPYETARARAGLPPQEIIAVEDSERGLRSAQAAGLRCAVVRTELAASCRFSGAWRVVDSISDLPPEITSSL